MRSDLDPKPEDPLDREIDERIRQVLWETPKPGGPTALQSRVFARIRRRRMLMRTACVAVVIALLSIAGLTSLRQTNRTPNPAPLAQQDDAPDAWLATLDTAMLSTPPPVVALDLLARDQHDMLDHLKSLDGVQK